jgi:hypothetical protein
MAQLVLILAAILVAVWILAWILSHVGLVVIGVLGFGLYSWWKARSRA